MVFLAVAQALEKEVELWTNQEIEATLLFKRKYHKNSYMTTTTETFI